MTRGQHDHSNRVYFGDTLPRPVQSGGAGAVVMLVVHAYIEVTDATLGVDFYCKGLGLTLKRRLSPTWIELGGATLPIFLLANRPPIAVLGHPESAA